MRIVWVILLALCFIVSCDDAGESKDSQVQEVTEVTELTDSEELEVDVDIELSEVDQQQDEFDQQQEEMETSVDVETTELESDLDLVDVEEPDIPDAPICGSGNPIREMQGRVVDIEGEGLAGVRPQACLRGEDGILECLRPETSMADGSFSQSFDWRCLSELTLRVMLPLGGLTTTYCVADLPEVGGVVRFEEPFVLYPTIAATLLPEKGDGGVERWVSYANGVEIEVLPDALVLGSIDYDSLALAEVDPSSPGLCFLDDSPAKLYGFYPEGKITGEGFAMRFPNDLGLAAGASVELAVLGGLDCVLPDGTEVAEGEWHRYGQGVVSSDGSRIDFSGDSALTCMTWIGLYTEE